MATPSTSFIADMHCDLLCYLANDPIRSPYDPLVRCSIPQLQEGHVKLQIMAIFTETGPSSSKSGIKQAEVFKQLPYIYCDVFEHIKNTTQFDHLSNSKKIGIIPAIENASSFCSDDDNLEASLHLLTEWKHKIGKMAYISLTWNTENRFGGGANTDIGLKNDGKRLLDYMAQHQIALDLSHTSDRLAYDLLNHLEKENLSLPVIASHSNLRSLVDVPRNLPDDLVKEIVRRQGVVGMNFVRSFIGADSPDYFSKQFERFLSLGAVNQLCFGADFFFNDDVSPMYRKPPEVCFFPSYDHAGAYYKVIDLWRKHGIASEEVIGRVCNSNLTNFLRQKIYVEV